MKKIIILIVMIVLVCSTVFGWGASRSISGQQVTINVDTSGLTNYVLEENVPCSASGFPTGCGYYSSTNSVGCVFGAGSLPTTIQYSLSCSSGSVSGQMAFSGTVKTITGDTQIGGSGCDEWDTSKWYCQGTNLYTDCGFFQDCYINPGDTCGFEGGYYHCIIPDAVETCTDTDARDYDNKGSVVHCLDSQCTTYTDDCYSSTRVREYYCTSPTGVYGIDTAHTCSYRCDNGQCIDEPSPTCPNGVCDSGETYLTCAADCDAPPVSCTVDSQCGEGKECKEGVCKSKFNISDYLPYILLMFGALVMVSVFK